MCAQPALQCAFVESLAVAAAKTQEELEQEKPLLRQFEQPVQFERAGLGRHAANQPILRYDAEPQGANGVRRKVGNPTQGRPQRYQI